MTKMPVLTPPNRSALWSSLALTKAQLAELCGITTRQVSHWTLRGYITTAERHPDRYNGEAIDLCVLIKQGLSNGLPLRRSVMQARAFIADGDSRQPRVNTIAPPALLDIRDQLRAAESAIHSVLESVRPLVPQRLETGDIERRA